MIFPFTRKFLLGNLSNKFKNKKNDKKNIIDGEFEDIEDENDRKL